MNRIVVGVDGSENSAVALVWAIAEARVRKAWLEAVMAWDFLEQRHLRTEPAFDPDYDQEKAEEVLEEFISDVLGEVDRDVIEPVSVCGNPADILLERARGADLLVVGARGQGALRRALLGSVSDSCVRGSHIPVVVVPMTKVDE